MYSFLKNAPVVFAASTGHFAYPDTVVFYHFPLLALCGMDRIFDWQAIIWIVHIK